MLDTPTFGNVVTIYYKGGPEGEEPTDVCVEGEPLTFVIGSLSVPTPLETALMEMHRGEEQTVRIPADRAFGVYEERYTEWYPRILLPKGDELQVGDIIFWQPENATEKVPARITDANEDLVKVDLNHPMAGKDVVYWVKLLDFS